MTFNIGWDTTTNKDILKNLLAKLFDNTQRQAMVEYRDVVKELKTSDYYERRARQAGLTGVQELADGEEIPMADPVLDTTQDLTQVRYGLGFKITSGMKKYNKWDEMKKMTKNLGMVMREFKDVEIAKMWNNATATTYASGFDTLALASNSHTCLDDEATTYDNYLDGDLGYTTLQSATVYFDTLVDDMGDDMPVTPNKLIVHPQLRFTATELIDSTKKPGTADNDVNALKDWDLSYFVYHRLTSSTFWALLAFNHPDYDLINYTSQEPDIKIQDSPDTSRSTIVTSEQWFKFGFGDGRMAFIGNT